MLDLKYVLGHLDEVREKTAQRHAEVDLDAIERLAARRLELIQSYETTRHEQRQAGESMRTIDKKSEAFLALRARLKQMSEQLKAWDSERGEVEAELERLLLYIPNLPDADVPVGDGEQDNVEVRRRGEPRDFEAEGFAPLPHWELGERLGILDFERGAAVSGARFTFLLGAAARLERALISFMLDLHTGEHGYLEMLPPFLVGRDAMTGTGQLPKFEADAFHTNNDLFLIPTAEVPVTNYHREQILEADALPRRYVAFSPCFRLEAGGHGRDTRGLIRQHQFNKVELVQLTRPEDSAAAHEALTGHAEQVLQRLELPYRVVSLCTADLGFSARRCYDLEVWLPGQGAYREISSCSNFGDFQARRANIRYRPEPGGKPRFVHTLNGSGLAVGRTLLAVLENHQQADGSVRVPAALRPYMGGLERISAPPQGD